MRGWRDRPVVGVLHAGSTGPTHARVLRDDEVARQVILSDFRIASERQAPK